MDPEDVEAILRPVPRARSNRARALRRHGREVHRRRGDGAVRRARHARGRSRASRARRARHPRLRGRGRARAHASGSRPAKRSSRSTRSPDAGEGMASGDVVNTAARLQTAAPVNGVLVDETTYRATRARRRLRGRRSRRGEGQGGAGPRVGGADGPLPLRRRRRARGTRGARRPRARARVSPRCLRPRAPRANAAARHARRRAGDRQEPPRLRAVSDRRRGPELITWRQGRCLAYGDGVDALGARARSSRRRPASPSRTRRPRSSREAPAGRRRRAGGCRRRGLGRVEAAVARRTRGRGGARRRPPRRRRSRPGDASSRRWPSSGRSCSSSRTSTGRTRACSTSSTSSSTGSPMFRCWSVATARPELLERRPGWGGGKLNATTLALAPLTRRADRAPHRATPGAIRAARRSLSRRCSNGRAATRSTRSSSPSSSSSGARPTSSGSPRRSRGSSPPASTGSRETEKDLLRDAAVIGKVFWASAVRDGSTTRRRRCTRSSAKDSYAARAAHPSKARPSSRLRTRSFATSPTGRSRAPTAPRSTVSVAEWIEGLGRPEDHAEMLAHHWGSALELVSCRGDGRRRARGPGPPRAARGRRPRLRAATHTPRPSVLRARRSRSGPTATPSARTLFRRARALHIAGDDRRRDALEEARDALLEAGDSERAAEAEAFLAHGAWYRGDRDAAERHFSQARERSSPTAVPSRRRRACSRSLRALRMLEGDHEQAIRVAQEALALAEASRSTSCARTR